MTVKMRTKEYEEWSTYRRVRMAILSSFVQCLSSQIKGLYPRYSDLLAGAGYRSGEGARLACFICFAASGTYKRQGWHCVSWFRRERVLVQIRIGLVPWVRGIKNRRALSVLRLPSIVSSQGWHCVLNTGLDACAMVDRRGISFRLKSGVVSKSVNSTSNWRYQSGSYQP